MELLENLEEVLIGDEGVLISLRMGDGLNKGKVEEACTILDKLAIMWSETDSIPKKAVDLFINIYPVLMTSQEHYSEHEAREIMDAADQLMIKVINCVNP
ncbi:hypothetical protein [Paenibacillus ferrarius]|uniref:hypothetical protein n=1 Tax=Paenibacillus ferrarius TaxID=1469647 RepID=UPI001FC908B9|nr:hypothetical protein [Paenibacillus ferrarius]